MTETYRAFVVHKDDDATRLAYEERPVPEPQDGEVVVQIAWSCVNYKDGLATLPKGGVVRAWPRVPGVDMSGVVSPPRATSGSGKATRWSAPATTSASTTTAATRNGAASPVTGCSADQIASACATA